MTRVFRAGGEQRVATYATKEQSDPDMTGLPDGGWIVTWEARDQAGNAGIYQQRFDSNGLALGGEQRVNTNLAGSRANPEVTALPDGGWLVTWESIPQPGNVGYGIFQQRFGANGQVLGGEQQVSSLTPAHGSSANVTTLSGGGWVVTWESYGQDGDGYGVYQRHYDSHGSAKGSEELVNTTTAGGQKQPSVTGLKDGG